MSLVSLQFRVQLEIWETENAMRFVQGPSD